MTETRKHGMLAALTTALVFLLIVGFWRFPDRESLGQPKEEVKPRPRPEETAVNMTSARIQLTINFGLKDKKGKNWSGDVKVTGGAIQSMQIKAGGKAKVEGNSFKGSSFKRKQGRPRFVRPELTITLKDASAETKVAVSTKQGEFAFTLKETPPAGSKKFFKGQVSVAKRAGTVRLTNPVTEDDYPVMAEGKNGNIWLVYNEYMPGQEVIKERVLAGNFDELVPKGNGDQLRLKRFDGEKWHVSIPVTEMGQDIWRPTVSVDGKGNVIVAWSQQRNDNWDIYYRVYTPGAKDPEKGNWSKIQRLTEAEGADFHVVGATDSEGLVWLAWQAWREGRFHIMLAALADKHAYSRPKMVSNGEGNSWSPSITANSQGTVYLAWDAYDGDSYNVHLLELGPEKKRTINVAQSPRFEARPNIVCDAEDRVWIAYEEGDEQWGKDYSTGAFKKIGFDSNPGNGLYINRTVQVKCLVDGEMAKPKADLQAALAKTLQRNKSVPRLAVDAKGGLWLLVRHHPNAGGRGEVWNSFALRFNGRTWTKPRLIADSANLMDNRPALVPYQGGILEVHSSDERIRSANRKQTDLFAGLLTAPDNKQPELTLVADEPDNERKVAVVHPNEAEDVAGIRKYRINYKGKKLRLYRGEFHRHTEFTAHRDGDGLLEDSWRYALDAASLDWMGNGDHDNGFHHEYPWWQIQKMTDLFNHPPMFTAAQTYERSNRYPNGHRNVIMPKRGIRPLPRGNLKGTPAKGTPDTKILYRYLKHFGGICASHTSGTNMGTDWRDNDPVVEPIVEIYQGHRHNYEHFGAPRSATKDTQIGGYQPAGFVWNAFEKGIKFGFQSSSDHISTHMSYAVVLTEDVSRQGIIDAFKRRHSYGATDNIILDVRSGDHLMGDIFKTGEMPQLHIKAIGTKPIAKLHVIRNNKYVYSIKPNKQEVDVVFTDARPMAGKESYYYVRVEQEDGNLAWASPMWITYVPKN